MRSPRCCQYLDNYSHFISICSDAITRLTSCQATRQTCSDESTRCDATALEAEALTGKDSDDMSDAANSILAYGSISRFLCR